MMSALNSNRRQDGRCAVSVDCRIEGVRDSVRITDLSLTGGYVDTRLPFSAGQQVQLTIALDGDVVVRARIVHSQRGVGFGFAIDFAHSAPDARQRIATSLASSGVTEAV